MTIMIGLIILKSNIDYINAPKYECLCYNEYGLGGQNPPVGKINLTSLEFNCSIACAPYGSAVRVEGTLINESEFNISDLR